MIKPEAGQWWVCGNLRRLVVGETHHGIVVEGGDRDDHQLGYITCRRWDGWHHEPRCTGWDWVAPDQPQPAEDPDKWVIQDRVPVRRGIDRINWVENSVDTSCEPFDLSIGKMHGYVNRHGATLYVYCRRRDLPKAEQVKSVSVSVDSLSAWKREQFCKAFGVELQVGPDTPEPQPQKTDGGINWSYHEKQKPQPKKTMLRLWIDSDCNVHAGLKGDRDLELLYDHETRQFYTEELL